MYMCIIMRDEQVKITVIEVLYTLYVAESTCMYMYLQSAYIHMYIRVSYRIFR